MGVGIRGGANARMDQPSPAVADDPTAPAPSDFGSPEDPVMPAAPPAEAPGDPTELPMGDGIEPVEVNHCGANNPAGLNDQDVARLREGGDVGGARVLYPYDGTVFPRGLIAPLLMWEGAADAVYVHLEATRFTYDGCLVPTAPGQLAFPQDVWDLAGQKTLGAGDPFRLELTLWSAGQVTGPMTQSFTIAKATLKGSVYYNNSYSSKLSTGPAAGGIGFGGFGAGGAGIVLRIPAGGTAEAFTTMECNGCHSVSANGTRLLSQTAATGARSFKLEPGAPPDPPPMTAGPRGAYGALTPDGTMYLSTSVAVDVARSSLAGIGAAADATLYNTDDGSVVPSTGIPPGALMPMFSPDGRHLVFNDFAIDQAHGLAMVDFDADTKTASNYRMLYQETDRQMRPGWPFMLPDNQGVIFARTNSVEFSGEGAGLSGLPTGPISDLYMVDVDSGETTMLARTMGYATPEDARTGTTYLPFGADDLGKAYYPTVSPVAAGGYFWFFFDAVRHYGNLGLQRQLWCAAVDVSPEGDYGVDLSHPAFDLPGQEFGTGNHRAFAALDPCRQDGDECTTGVDCCGGFCYIEEQQELVDPVGSCSSTTTTCAELNERCEATTDCCRAGAGEPPRLCIAGFCAEVGPPQ